MNVQHILYAEDDPHDLQLTLAALDESNLANKIVVVRDGEEALDYLYCREQFKGRTDGDPVAVLLDLKMPKVDGLEVLKIIKGDENLKMIPVIVLTSSREAPDVIGCYSHGVNAYVVKPVDSIEFVKAVKQLGIFWAVVNEPPFNAGKEEAVIPAVEITSPGKKGLQHEIPAPRLASGG
jgi:CheY-like chemotaxis protein